MPRTQRPAVGGPGQLVTIPDVELARVGHFALSTGPTTFTNEHLSSMVAASLDPDTWDAPVHVGHDDDREGMGHRDGDPALGWVENLRVVGDRLRGDLVNVPAALASIIPTAYPQRSVEVAFGLRTPNGRRYPAALIGLALLGRQLPGMPGLGRVDPAQLTSLHDVLRLYGVRDSSGLAAATAAAESVVRITLEDAAPAQDQALEAARAAASAGYAAAAALEAVRAASTTPPAPSGQTGPDAPPTPGGPAMPPLTDARVRELLNVAEGQDAEAALTQLLERARTTPDPAATGAPGAAGQPAAGAPAAGAPAGGAPAAGDPANGTPAAGGANGTPAPAPGAGAGQATDPPAGGTTPAGGAPAGAGGTPANGTPAALELPEGLVAVPAEVLAQLQSGATAGTQALETQEAERFEADLVAAANAGRVLPPEVPWFRTTWQAEGVTDPAARAVQRANARALLDSRTVALVPVTELGSDAAGLEGDPTYAAAAAGAAGTAGADPAYDAFAQRMGWAN